ncbi:MAG: SDR family NAD(P)-dependent oxidoreductase [Anaerolineae bacterium]|nr:SDR family NAD(P)-dependent oxidoreductase [Anaerolineae bacterium]
MSGERVLVTGGSGFIGSALVEELVRRGADVTCVLLPPDPAAHLAEVRQEIRICRADLADLEAVRDAVKAARPEAVFHLAATGVADVQVDPALAVRVNVEGTLNLLNALQGNYRAFVNTGTCHEYGGNEPPFREDQDPRPELPYAITKTAAWHFCNRYHRTAGWPIVTLRPFSVYGPRQAPNAFIPACIHAAQVGRDFDMTLGEQTRDCVYVDDIVEGFILAATVPEAIGGTFNLCTSREVPLYRIAQVIVEQMGHPIAIHRGALPYRGGEIWRLVGDNGRAREILGWAPRVSLGEGLRRTIAAAGAHG